MKACSPRKREQRVRRGTLTPPHMAWRCEERKESERKREREGERHWGMTWPTADNSLTSTCNTHTHTCTHTRTHTHTPPFLGKNRPRERGGGVPAPQQGSHSSSTKRKTRIMCSNSLPASTELCQRAVTGAWLPNSFSENPGYLYPLRIITA